MNETRESCLAAILARGLIRVRQRAERTGMEQRLGDDEPLPTAVALPGDVHRPAEPPAAGSKQGEPQ